MALSPLSMDDDLTEASAAATSITEPLPLKTYALDFAGGNIGGMVDGREAIQQAVIKAIATARYRFPIYDFDYGSELDDLIGQGAPLSVLQTEVPRAITEALIYDDRISGVHTFSITKEADALYVSFFVDVDNDSIPVEVTL